MKKRALLVNPWIVDFAAYDFWLRPLALMMAGSFLRNAGFEVTLVDCLDTEHHSLPDKRPKRRSDGTSKYLKTDIPKPAVLKFVPRIFGRYGISLDAFDADLSRIQTPDIILLTCYMTYWYPGAVEAVRRLRAHWPGVPIVLGGRYATLCPDHARETVGPDIVYKGPLGPEFGRIVSDITGVHIDVPDSFADFPAPAHDLHPTTYSSAVVFTRGCPYRCTYCVSHILAPRFECRSPEDAAEEIRTLASRGARHIAFYDDALLVDAEKFIIPLMRSLVGTFPGLSFHTPNALHAALITREIAGLMKQAGFARVMLGLESTDSEFQHDTGGKIDTGNFERACALLREAGFRPGEIGAYVICGHPAQTEDSIREAMRASARAGANPVPADYSPIPGSADFAAAVASFRRPPDADPLLQNSSIIQWQHPALTPDAHRRIRHEARELVRGIREG